MDLLRKNLAPITDEAWKEINEQAQQTLNGNLSARGLVDFSGPHGLDMAAVNLGRLDCPKVQSVKGLEWGQRTVLPLVEIRVPFSLGMWDLDDVARGSKDPELEPVEKAAQNAALFEEKAIYDGFKAGGITGITEATPHKPITLGRNAQEYQAVIEKGIVTLQKAGVGGPYDLVLGNAPHQTVMAGDERGYPLVRRLKDLLGGDIHWSPAVSGGILLSRRGGDFELTVGVDFAIGYAGHTGKNVDLYLTESFTFRVLEPRAAVEFKLK
jgi:uncharacterized linocin/CFP29 family protein